MLPLLGICPEKIIIPKDTCTLVFRAVLSTTARTQKHPRCSSTGEWIKMWYIYTREYYSAMKRNESAVVMGMNLEAAAQSGVREKQILYISTHIWNLEPICRAGTERQTQRTDLWAELGKENMGQTEGSTDVRAL